MSHQRWSSILPTGTPLGKLYIERILGIYDGPKLFVAKSDSGSKYIAIWIESLENAERWFYSAISDGRLKDFLEAKISIRSIYSSAESGWIYEIIIPKMDVISSAKLISKTDIDHEDLPPEDDFLDAEDLPG